MVRADTVKGGPPDAHHAVEHAQLDKRAQPVNANPTQMGEDRCPPSFTGQREVIKQGEVESAFHLRFPISIGSTSLQSRGDP